MDFAETEEQVELRNAVGRILSERVTDDYWKRREPEPYDRELWRTLAEAGILGTAIPETYGGSGLGIVELGIVLQEQGRTLAPVPLLCTLAVGALPIARFASLEACARWLPKIVQGEAIVTAAFSEPGRTDPLQPATRAELQGDSWRLTGRKVCVPYASQAALVLVPAVTAAGERVFLLDPRTEGCRLIAQTSTNGEPQAAMELENAAAEELLGGNIRGAEALPWLVAHAEVAATFLLIGVAEEALRRTAEYVSNRHQFGRPVGTFQAVQHRLANAYTDLAAMRSTVCQAAWKLDSGLPATADCSVAYWWACRGADRVVHAAQHSHGGLGADLDYPIHRYFLWARQIAMLLGGAMAALSRIGREMAAGRLTPLTAEGVL